MAAPKENKFALGNSGGRPPIYDNPEEAHEKCNEYFLYCIDKEEKPTITGLALYLGFSSRSTLNEYAKKEEFSYIIKRAMLVVENSYENSATTFDMFALKNMGWKDKTETDITTKGQSLNNYSDLTDEELRQKYDAIKKPIN